MSFEFQANTRRWPTGCTLIIIFTFYTFLVLIVNQSSATSPSSQAASLAALTSSSHKLLISSQGIVVPKSPTLIAGLNHQFNRVNSRAVSNSSSQQNAVHKVGGILAAAVGLASSNQFGSISSASSRIKQANATLIAANLYLDKHQQELLAANPTIPSNHLLTRSDVSGPSDSHDRSGSSIASHKTANSQQQQQRAEAATSGNQQSYRGYSLIEIEVKSEQDRRYVNDLYANLSAALNEQAERRNSFSVSPYVDIDFWSFKSDLNDQIDIMVSPKSRAFMLNQLTRARVKHRVKIDDIQTKLDQQQVGYSASSSLGANIELVGRQSGDKLHAGEQVTRLEPKLDTTSSATPMNDSYFFENYQRLADINKYLETIVSRAPGVASVQVIGRSTQGRYLRVLKLGLEQEDLEARFEAESANELETEPAALTGKLQPTQLNASTIMSQFMNRQQSVKKLGSIWLDGGTHAREWISPATVLYLSFRLADNYAKCQRFFEHLRQSVTRHEQASLISARSATPNTSLDDDLLNGINEINTSLLQGTNLKPKPRPRTELDQMFELVAKRPQEVASEHACDLELEQLVRKYTFYIMPVLNPDGYEYSHTHNRLWRKTRSISNHPIYRHFCLGADPNRNYDARHGGSGSSSHPCSQTYGGTTPFTEPETRHQSNFVYAHRDTLKMYISFHSYSQMILLPFSHSRKLAPDHEDLNSVGQAAVKAIERTHGVQYRVGPSATILYEASGTASDWAYEKAGIKYSYTIELRDTGSYGFLLPRNQIVPTGEETFNGLLAMISQMEKNDNLLTSKSSLVSARGVNSTETGSTTGMVHAPDMDQFRPFGRFRPKPAQLENALDGSDTWATPSPQAPGVRARNPTPDVMKSEHLAEEEVVSVSDEEPDAGLAFEGEGELMEPTNNLSVSSALSGQSSDAAAESAAKLLGHIHAQISSDSQQQQQQQTEQQLHHLNLNLNKELELLGRKQSSMRQRLTSSQLGLSSSGRSLINQPPQPTRTTSISPRRELSSAYSD